MSDTTKILFSSDLHGSDSFFLKVLSTAKSQDVDVVFMSGDITGKAIVPIVKLDSGNYATKFFGRDIRAADSELAKLKSDIRRSGYYYYVCSRPEYETMRASPDGIEKLFEQLMKEVLLEWIQKIKEVLPEKMKVVMNPGNDDPFSIDEVLKKSDRTLYTTEKVEDIDGRHELVSCDWVNPTPWKSPRECSEQELEKRLRKEIDKVPSTENLICDFHVPPYNTPLDLAPKLDKNLQPKMSLMTGGPIMEHVGSKAIRKVLEEYQPKLSLHGHIHESPGHVKIGRTLAINPGSEYVEGVMHAYLLRLGPDGGIDYQPMIGG